MKGKKRRNKKENEIGTFSRKYPSSHTNRSSDIYYKANASIHGVYP